MSDCPFYNVDVLLTERRTISADRQRQPPSRAGVPWCSHDESPVTPDDANSVLGGGRLLKCGGRVKDCQIPQDRLEAWIQENS